ncbi:MAG: restriction endonuclease subunit S [Burkholderiales bacterium]|nr:restriction endonuclease subunit S [Burkholderiales bacterium]
MNFEKENLPRGWESTNVGEICTDLQYGYTASASEENCGPRLLRITDIQGGRVIWNNVPYCEIDTKNIAKYELHAGDIVFARTGGTVGKSFIIDSTPEKSVFASYLIRLSPHKEIFSKFLYYFFQSLSYWEQIGLKKGGLQGNVNAKTLSSLQLNICSFNEQKRIVAKIEELFSELDKGIESLKTVRQQFKVYRQSVLKHAFEGKLTADWREENKDKLETAEVLLERIKQERESAYQQQLEEWEAAVKEWEQDGKEGKKPTKPRKQKDVSSPTEEELIPFSKLPPTWQWVKLGELVWSVKDGPHYTPKYSDDGIPFISGDNVRPTGVDFENVKYISEGLHKELSARCKPELDDLLYTKGGTTGIARVNTYDFEFNVWVHVAVLKFTKTIKPFYLQHALNSPKCYSQSQKYTHGVGNQDLYGKYHSSNLL